MLSLPPALALLVFTTRTTFAEPFSLSQYINRGVIPRPASIPKDGPDVPSPGSISGGGRIGGGSSIGSGGLTWSNIDKPPSADDIVYAPAKTVNSCFSSERCHEVLEVAGDVIEQLANAIGGGSASTTSIPPTFTTRTRTSTATPTSSLKRPLPYLETANRMARLGVDEAYLGLLTSEQQNMFVSSPVCYFANVERMYESAATTSRNASSTTIVSSRTATTTSSIMTSSPQKRCNGHPGVYYDCDGVSSTLASTTIAALETEYFGTKLPSYLKNVYAPVTTSSIETATTTCSGFESGETFAAAYVREVVATSSENVVAAQTAVAAVNGAPVTGVGGFTQVLGALGVIAVIRL